MRGNVIRFVIALAAFAIVDPARPVIAEEHEPEATSNDSALSQGSVRIDSVVVDIERINGRTGCHFAMTSGNLRPPPISEI